MSKIVIILLFTSNYTVKLAPNESGVAELPGVARLVGMHET
jgi:hypothetical protein